MSPIRWGRAALLAPVLLSGCSVMQGFWSGEPQRVSGLLERTTDGFVLRECGSERVMALTESQMLDGIYQLASQPGQIAISPSAWTSFWDSGCSVREPWAARRPSSLSTAPWIQAASAS